MTRASRLAIEALVGLADSSSQEWMTAKELSRRTAGDLAFLQQLLNRPARQGIIRSRQGRGGGYQLGCNPKKLTLKAFIDSIDGRDVQQCLFDATSCDGTRHCRLKPTWHLIREYLYSFLESVTIHTIAERSRSRVMGDN